VTGRILFVDPNHGPRAQMAEALLRARAAGQLDVASAGTEPGARLDEVADVLAEAGIIDFRPTRRTLTSVLDPPPDLLIAVCEEGCAACPFVAGARRVQRWPFPDPAELPADQRADGLRRIRDELGELIEDLVATETSADRR
jgi:protein-tyrosine-phosphatase